jgi:hypothetical protein
MPIEELKTALKRNGSAICLGKTLNAVVGDTMQDGQFNSTASREATLLSKYTGTYGHLTVQQIYDLN